MQRTCTHQCDVRWTNGCPNTLTCIHTPQTPSTPHYTTPHHTAPSTQPLHIHTQIIAVSQGTNGTPPSAQYLHATIGALEAGEQAAPAVRLHPNATPTYARQQHVWLPVLHHTRDIPARQGAGQGWGAEGPPVSPRALLRPPRGEPVGRLRVEATPHDAASARGAATQQKDTACASACELVCACAWLVHVVGRWHWHRGCGCRGRVLHRLPAGCLPLGTATRLRHSLHLRLLGRAPEPTAPPGPSPSSATGSINPCRVPLVGLWWWGGNSGGAQGPPRGHPNDGHPNCRPNHPSALARQQALEPVSTAL